MSTISILLIVIAIGWILASVIAMIFEQNSGNSKDYIEYMDSFENDANNKIDIDAELKKYDVKDIEKYLRKQKLKNLK